MDSSPSSMVRRAHPSRAISRLLRRQPSAADPDVPKGVQVGLDPPTRDLCLPRRDSDPKFCGGRWVGTPPTRPEFFRKPAVQFGTWIAYPIRASRQAWIRHASNEALYDYASHVLRFADNPEGVSNEPGWLRVSGPPLGQYKGSLHAWLPRKWAIRRWKKSQRGHDDRAALDER